MKIEVGKMYVTRDRKLIVTITNGGDGLYWSDGPFDDEAEWKDNGKYTDTEGPCRYDLVAEVIAFDTVGGGT